MSQSGTEEGDAVPHALLVRMEELRSAHGAGLPRAANELELDAAIRALAALIARDPSEHTALELLAIDGLTTRAFGNAQDPAALEALADRACSELMALGSDGA